MPNGDTPTLEYSRQSLRKATKFVEGDYSGINPRQFYRSLKRSLEEIQEGDDFKYSTHGTQQSAFEIKSEEVGEKTGRVEGRLVASSEPREIGTGRVEYRPYGPHGALTILIGGFVFLIGLTGEIGFAVVGLLAMIGGGYLYFQSEEGEFPVKREDFIRTLMTGEVSERTIQGEAETRTDIFANMSVIYAGDSLLTVATDELETTRWTLRRAVTTQVNKWYNRLVDQNDTVSVSDGFWSELGAWSNRDARSDIQTINRRQEVLNDDFALRIQYTDILMDQLPGDTRDELDEHQENLLSELESLSEDMDIYVEREGLQHVT